MIHILSAIHTFTFFLALAVSGFGSPFFWLPLLLLIAGLFGAWKLSEIESRRLWVLLTLPAIWVLTGLLGGYFWVDWQHMPVQRSPPWVLSIIGNAVYAFLIVGLGSILYLEDGRWFASIYFVINLYFMIAMEFLAGMAVTGNWL